MPSTSLLFAELNQQSELPEDRKKMIPGPKAAKLFKIDGARS